MKKHIHKFDEYIGYPYGRPDMKLYKCKCGKEEFNPKQVNSPSVEERE